MDIKTSFLLNYFCLLILYFNYFVNGNNYGFCANPECSIPVSKGITVLRYHSPDDVKISVEVNEEVLIFVKDYGPKKDLWGIVTKGNRGYISNKFIRETEMLVHRTVPATVEFKRNLPGSESFTVSSHLHVSSQQLQSGTFMNDVIPESSIQTGTVQQDFISMPPNNFQHNQDGVDPNINFDSRFIQSSQFNIPIQSSHSHFSSPPHVPGVESENIFSSPTPVPSVYSSQYQFVSDVPMHHSQYLGSSLNNVPYHEQQGNHHGVHDVPNSVFSSQTSQTAYENPSVHPNSFEHPSIHPNSFEHPSIHPSSFEHSNVHRNSFEHSNVHPNSFEHPSIHPSTFEQPNVQSSSFEQSSDNSRSFEHSNVHSAGFEQPSAHLSGFVHSSVHQSSYEHSMQQFHSSHGSEMHSSVYSQNNDDEIAKTLSMLSDRGFDDNDVYGNSFQSDVHSFSQNLDGDFNVNEGDSSKISRQSQHQPVLNNDGSFFPHVNPNQQVEVNVVNTQAPEAFMDNNNNKLPENVLQKVTDAREESEEQERENEADIAAEEDEDEAPDENDDENLDAFETDESILNSKQVQNAEMQFNIQSSMSTTQNEQQTSERHQNFPDFENSIRENSLITENSIDMHTEATIISNFNENSEGDSILNTISKSVIGEKFDSITKESISESFTKSNPNILEKNDNGAFLSDSTVSNKEQTTPKINDFFVKSEQSSELDKISGAMDIEGISNDLPTYHIRKLNGEFGTTEDKQSDSDSNNDENNTQSDSETHGPFANWLDAFRTFVDAIMAWIPEPLYSALMDLRNKNLSPRVPVFTALCGFICIFLIVPVICLKEWSKESRLTAQLASVEKDAYTLSATNSVLEEKLESVQSELAALQASLAEEKSATKNLKMCFEDQEEQIEKAKAEVECSLQVIDSLKEKENEYLTTIQDQAKEIERFAEHKEALDKIMKDQENSILELTDQLQESENKVKELEKEKLQFLQLKEDYEEKLSQFDKNCKQLLQEAEVWNLRVQELTNNLSEEEKVKQECVESLKVKDEEIEALKELVETFKLIEEIEDPEEQAKAKEEKLQSLMDSSIIINQLKQEEEKSKLIDEQLTKEKNKILEMEVELLEAKSEIDKLKVSYNQALQDKAEAQTKLDILTNYFKDKEIQMQKQLGAQEAVRQKKEEDVNSAERRICLIEQENASYKYQVASMKQEMEETERNLKSQIATQEKKAHENWIAARAAERKLEDMKQEVTQLRQRLTLLEREQENWANAPRDEVIRPVPKRIPGMSDESGSQDLNTSERGMFPPRLPPPHMLLPPDRPLPPLPPPPIPPMFLPHMERHFRPQPPWHIPPEHSTDYRTTPEFMAGRESTPPRGRQATITDEDAGPHASSPLTTDTRDSRNSTPPHLLPDFHDVPPQPGRPFYPPPPLGHPRLPMHPPFRRDAGSGPKRLDHPSEFNSRSSQQVPPQEQWQHSRV